MGRNHPLTQALSRNAIYLHMRVVAKCRAGSVVLVRARVEMLQVTADQLVTDHRITSVIGEDDVAGFHYYLNRAARLPFRVNTPALRRTSSVSSGDMRYGFFLRFGRAPTFTPNSLDSFLTSSP